MVMLTHPNWWYTYLKVKGCVNATINAISMGESSRNDIQLRYNMVSQSLSVLLNFLPRIFSSVLLIRWGCLGK